MKEASHKLLQLRAPKYLWDECLELEASIRSNTANDIYKLDRDVSKTMMSGETSYITQFYKIEWIKQVMFHNKAAPFPDNVLTLGYCLGPSIDVGTAMTSKILIQKGQVLHRSTYRPLTPNEISHKDGSKA